VNRAGVESSRALADDKELLRLLADPFGLEFPAETRLPIKPERT
jgi:hypothetical protein